MAVRAKPRGRKKADYLADADYHLAQAEKHLEAAKKIDLDAQVRKVEEALDDVRANFERLLRYRRRGF